MSTIGAIPAAKAEFKEAFGWYEAHATGLGANFLRKVNLAEASLSREPMLYALVRAPLRRYPYALFYVVESDCVVVLACLHHRCDPQSWPVFNLS